MYNIWEFEVERKRMEQIRKNILREIGTRVDSFFLDKAPELGFEERTGQWEMAMEITEAMVNKKHILVEAGVGIGKTYAYIVPLLYYHKRYKKPIIIATSTIALQEQLASDLKTIQNIFKYNTDILIAKGQNHFLCKNRLVEYFFGKKNTEEYEYYKEMDKGGHEKADWDIDIPDKIWKQVNISSFNPRTCKDKCPHKDYCFYYQLRQDLRTTNGFILCNQDLLTMNMRKRNSYNNEIFNSNFEYIVIDEAHNLESRVRNSYTTQLTYYDCINAVEKSNKINKMMDSVLDKKILKCLRLIEIVFGNLMVQVNRQDIDAQINDKEIERYYVKNNFDGLTQLSRMLRDIHSSASSDFGKEDTYRNRGDDEILEKIEKMYDFFESLNKIDSKDIFWMNANKKNKRSIAISRCPKNVNELTEELLFSSNEYRVILTSATISSGGESDYNYFISNTNLPVDETEICDSKESPFDYDSHAIIYNSENMPHPSNERTAFIEAGTKEIVNLLNITNGKALILFTAKRDMLQVYDALVKRVPYKILLENSGASQNETINEFKKDINSVLLATGSYWEGVSIEGISLSNLIIFRLPFPVPEPIIDYKTEISSNGLMDVLVPEMIIKLKQGIGRLIRNQSDFGIVSIIDPRLGGNSTSPYKRLVWDSLPIKNKTNDIEVAKKFYMELVNKKRNFMKI